MLLFQLLALLIMACSAVSELYAAASDDFSEIVVSLPQKDTVKRAEFGSEVVSVEKVEVRRTRRKYNKDNPAVALIKKLIAVRDLQNPVIQYPYFEYEKYEKIVISINDFKDIDSTNSLVFLNEHKMVNPQTQKTILPISLREEITYFQHQNNPKSENSKKLYYNNSGVDDRFSQSTVLAFLNEALPQIDIFNDNVYLLQRQFISPVAKNSFDFYRFTLSPDTVDYQGSRCLSVDFYPFSSHSLALRGTLLVEVDSTGKEVPFVRYVDLSIPNSADVNFLTDIYIEQSFTRDSSGMRVIEWESSSFDASPLKSVPALNIRRTNNFYAHSLVNTFESDNFLGSAFVDVETEDLSEEEKELIRQKTEQFQPTKQEREVIKLAKKLRTKPVYKIAEELLIIGTEGYAQLGKGSWFDIGPVAQFISGNTLEGTRLAFGGITTPNLSRHLFFDGVVAYGFGDKKWKYDLSLEYSFNAKQNFYKEYPINSLRATYSYDVYTFGSSFDALNKESIVSWLKRSDEQNQTYMRLAQLRYQREWKNNLSMSLYARNYTNYETQLTNFSTDYGEFPKYTMSEMQLSLRYAPGEKIYQTRRRRRQLSKYIPVIELSHTTGFKDLIGSNYSRNLTELRGYGRVNLQPFGYLNLDISARAEWDKVPYMLLPYPKTNLSYIVSDVDYFSLLKPLEFVNDKYVAFCAEYCLDGLIFSRLPLIKYLNLREVVTFKGLYGSLSDKNNPIMNPSQIPLPAHSSVMTNEPYMELGVGIQNILSVLRVDYVWRISYLDKPEVESGALMVVLKLAF